MRVANRVLALLVAAATVVFAVLFTIEVVAAVAGADPVVVHWHQAFTDGRHNTWHDAGPLVISSILLAVGAAMVLIQLTPRRVSRLPLTEVAPSVDAGMSPGGVRAALTSAAVTVDGVSGATARVRRGRGAVTARTYGDKQQAQAVRPRIESAVQTRLTDLALRRSMHVTVAVRPGKDPE